MSAYKTMGPVKLELNYPSDIDGVTLDPKPNWSLDDLISELSSLELKLNASSPTPIFTKMHSRELPNGKVFDTNSKSFVMRISDDEDEDSESDEETKHLSLVEGKRFSCNELYLSDTDSSEDAFALEEPEAYLINQVSLCEGFLSEREYEHQQGVKEDVRNKVSLLEIDVMNENEKSISALIQVEKYTDVRREMDRKLDTHYRRKIAEALDNHLVAVQRDHEHKSQIEERRIRNDAASEEAKRKERVFQEEKAAAIKRAEEAGLEAERIAKESAEKKVAEAAKKSSAEATQKLALGREKDATAGPLKEVHGNAQPRESETTKVQSGGYMIKASENALNKEADRLQKYKELDEKNQAIKSGSNKDIRRYELLIGRQIRQISGTKDSVRSKASELVRLFNDPLCSQSISIAAFAKTVVSQSETLSANFDSTAFACGHVIVLVTSQVPLAMDLLLAEFHRACIYTVPKHVVNTQSTLRKGYFKMLGYREEDGKIESTDQYLEHVESYIKLYAALVQTEVDGVENLHGLKEGWAWLARLLNALPINLYTAVALEAFLKMAGFALYRRYKSQFKKVLNQISLNFVKVLEAQKDPVLNRVIVKIKTYLDTNQFLKEPEGWRLQTSLLSDTVVPVADQTQNYDQNQYYNQNQPYNQNQFHQSNRWNR